MQRAVFPSSGRVFAFQDGGFVDTRPRAVVGKQDGLMPVLARRTSFLRIVFKVLRLVYYCASVGTTSIHSVIGPAVILSLAIKILAPLQLHNLASGADYPLDATLCVYTAARLYA